MKKAKRAESDETRADLHEHVLYCRRLTVHATVRSGRPLNRRELYHTQLLKGNSEMITPTTLYLMTRADDIKVAAIILCVLTTILFCFLFIGYIVTESEGRDYGSALMAKLTMLTAPFVAVFMAVAVLVPNTREVAAIIVIPRIANSESSRRSEPASSTLPRHGLKS